MFIILLIINKLFQLHMRVPIGAKLTKYLNGARIDKHIDEKRKSFNYIPEFHAAIYSIYLARIGQHVWKIVYPMQKESPI